MENNKEVWGNRLEVAGVVVVLAATFLQFWVTDWWDDQLREWQSLIQEEVNFSEMETLLDMSRMINAVDASEKRDLLNAIADRIGQAETDAIKHRDERLKAKKIGLTALFSSAKSFFVLLGAMLLAGGKALTYVAKHPKKAMSP